MDGAVEKSDLSALLADLITEAVERDVAPQVAQRAADATRRAVKIPSGPMSPQTIRRVEAYFGSVVRRASVNRSSAPRAAARFVVAAVVADLRSVGRNGLDIWSELERGWSASVPPDVLEEYRLRLCG
jgi:hypothetical protein